MDKGKYSTVKREGYLQSFENSKYKTGVIPFIHQDSNNLKRKQYESFGSKANESVTSPSPNLYNMTSPPKKLISIYNDPI